MNFEKFPSIGQFRTACKTMQDDAAHRNEKPEVVIAYGTVKLHGTNAAVCNAGGKTWLQTRERILPDDETHFGFRGHCEANASHIARIFAIIRKTGGLDESVPVHVYGEWVGKGIQKSVGMSLCEKTFVIFAVSYGEGDDRPWMPDSNVALCLAGLGELTGGSIYTSFEFTTWAVTIDFGRPTEVQNALVEITNEIEANCPVASKILENQFLPLDTELVGEGAVWTFTAANGRRICFKVKGDKHSASKVKTLASVDPELILEQNVFLDYAVTAARLQQGLDKLTEMGLDPLDRKSIGVYVKWVVGDVLSEEGDVIASSGLEASHIAPLVGKRAANYIIAVQKETPL